jgi:Fur family zinc uptake transcriptional regulator
VASKSATIESQGKNSGAHLDQRPGTEPGGKPKPAGDKPELETPELAFEAALDATLDSLAAQCEAKGGQLTNLRRLLMGILLRAGKPVKAYDLIEESARLGRRLTPATVYRVLEFLMGYGLVHRVNALNAFVACTDTDHRLGHQPLLLVCPSCRQTTEINDPDLAVMVFGKLNDLGHALKGGSIEVHGRCQLCADK